MAPITTLVSFLLTHFGFLLSPWTPAFHSFRYENPPVGLFPPLVGLSPLAYEFHLGMFKFKFKFEEGSSFGFGAAMAWCFELVI
ncbi:unnamed protein product [Prunus armeniaca]